MEDLRKCSREMLLSEIDRLRAELDRLETLSAGGNIPAGGALPLDSDDLLRQGMALKKAIETTQLGITITDTLGRIVYTNPAEAAMHGYSVDELIGRSYEIFAPSRLKRQIPIDQKFSLSRLSENIRKDGSAFPVRLTSDIVCDAAGTRIGIVTVCEDITERKIFEERLKRLETALEQAAESIVITDPGGKIEYVNPAFSTGTGFDKEEAIGRNFDMLGSERQGAPENEMSSTLAAGRPWMGHVVRTKKDGSEFEEEATISPITDSAGLITGYVSVSHNVTEIVRMERRMKEREKLAAIGEIAGAIAHEIKNPLFAVTSGIQVLEMELDPPSEQRQTFEAILRECMRVDRLIRLLRRYSTPVQLEKSRVSVRTLIDQAIRSQASLFQQKSVELVASHASRLPSLLLDPDRIIQVLLNLLQNALDASSPGSSVQVKSALHGRDSVRITVTDHGAGIEPEILPRVFEPFFSTKAGNSGMGLAVTRKIVHEHGGELTVETRPGEGSSFHVFLPVQEANA